MIFTDADFLRQEGREEGVLDTTRRHTISILTKRLGTLPAELIEKINSSEPVWCERMMERALEVESLTELNWIN